MVDFHKALQESKRREAAGELSFAEQMYKEQEEKDLKILSVIGSTEPSTFNELCNGLRRLNICPEKGDKGGWGNLFRKLGEFKTDGLVTIVMERRNMKTFQLTPGGADLIRDFADGQRELLNLDDWENETDSNPPWEL